MTMDLIRLFLCGDVMTGRGIDQILTAPCDPAIHEPWAKSALDYVKLAEAVNGPIPRRVEPAYIWGDALAELERERPEARIINLETAVTTSKDRAPKGINYRMNPANAACLVAAQINCCVLANNHVLDWGPAGLRETLATLHAASIRTAGAGCNSKDALAPAILELPGGGRVLVFAYAFESAGVPAEWAAKAQQAGVSWLPDLSSATADGISDRMLVCKRLGDILIVSLHWGSNWGYQVSHDQRRFARRLIEAGAADLVHGHSSHHPRPMEVYRGRLVLYGCGDFLNDYEGIAGYDSFRPELTLMYFPVLDAGSGELLQLTLLPMRLCRFRLNRASREEAGWLAATMRRESGIPIERTAEGCLRLGG